MSPPAPIRLVRSLEDATNDAPKKLAPPVDPTDIDQVFRRYARYVARIGRRILGDNDEVADLVQDVFVDAQRGLHNLRDPNAVRAWLARVAVRKAKRRLRQRAFRRSLGLGRDVDLGQIADPMSDQDRARILMVYRVLDTVPADARIAWVLNRVEGESLDHVAEVVGCSRATAHRRVQKAQRALEEGLDDF